MLNLIKFICSLLLILLLFIVFYLNYKQKKSKKVNPENMGKYPIFCITNFFSKFKHIKYTKEGELVYFRCEGEIQCMEECSNSIDLLNNNFYQINFLKYIKCREMKKVDLSRRKMALF